MEFATATRTNSRRELLRDVIGDDVDRLTEKSVGRVLAAIWSTVRRELDDGNPDQLELQAD